MTIANTHVEFTLNDFSETLIAKMQHSVRVDFGNITAGWLSTGSERHLSYLDKYLKHRFQNVRFYILDQ